MTTQIQKPWITIVTYNNPKALNNNLRTLFNSDIPSYSPYIEIINNHSNFYLDEEFRDKNIVVHHQTLRPDWAYWGHISRDYNSAILRGIKDLNNPEHDLIILMQDDILIKPDFMAKLEPQLEKYDAIVTGMGDTVTFLKPCAVKKVGMMDERFNLSFYEADYFLRCIKYLKDRVSINDYAHSRVWNPSDNGKYYMFNGPEGTIRAESDYMSCPSFTREQQSNVGQRVYKAFHLAMWQYKWGRDVPDGLWSFEFMNNIIPTLQPKCANYCYYPMFEMNVDGVFTEKEYIDVIWREGRTGL